MHKARAAGPWPAFNSLWFAKKLQGFGPTHPKSPLPRHLLRFCKPGAPLLPHVCCPALLERRPRLPGMRVEGCAAASRDAGNAGHTGLVQFATAARGEGGNKAPCIPLLPPLWLHT